jgi:uncharacterized radical SAM superfamily Fe-S cluster-containing enzyme
MRIIGNTKSICSHCEKVIPARVFLKKGRVFMASHCSEHGEVISDHVWDDPVIYRGLKKLNWRSSRPPRLWST